MFAPAGPPAAAHDTPGPDAPVAAAPVPAPDLAPVAGVLAQVAATLDPAALDIAAAQDLMGHLAHIRRSVDALVILVAGAIGDDTAFATTPERSAARWLARTLGATVGQARATIDTATVLDTLADLEAAVRTSALSGDQARIIADAATADPHATTDLLHHATQSSLFGLRNAADRVKANAHPDDPTRDHRAHTNRHLHLHTSPDGAGISLSGRGTAADGADLASALDPYQRCLFTHARRAGTRDSYAAHQWDALIALARHSLGHPAPWETPPHTDTGAADTGTDGHDPDPDNTDTADRTADRTADGTDTADITPPARPNSFGTGRPPGIKVIVRVDYTALVRGHTVPGETCDLVGIGPIPATTAAELATRGDTFLAAVITKGTQVHGVAHLGRRPTAHQITALQWLNPTCANAACDRPAHQWDHRHDWSTTHQTRLEDLDGLCTPDHALKTHHGYRLIDGPPGPRPFVPPHHPDHPGNPTHHPPPTPRTPTPPPQPTATNPTPHPQQPAA